MFCVCLCASTDTLEFNVLHIYKHLVFTLSHDKNPNHEGWVFLSNGKHIREKSKQNTTADRIHLFIINIIVVYYR